MADGICSYPGCVKVCPRGHEMTAENLVGKQCKTCANANRRARYARARYVEQPMGKVA